MKPVTVMKRLLRRKSRTRRRKQKAHLTKRVTVIMCFKDVERGNPERGNPERGNPERGIPERGTPFLIKKVTVRQRLLGGAVRERRQKEC